ncbi:hypothetical protein [Marinobacter salinus]|nr:hypothetical protein [Marinobacter salinus]
MAKSYTEHEHKIAYASKAWRHYQWICSDEYAQHEEDRHILIAGGNYTGRPPVPLQKQKDRALHRYEIALNELREYERDKHLKHMPEEEIKIFVKAKGHDKKGRKRGGRAIALQKYVRRIQRQVEETKKAPDSEFKPSEGRGRPKMSREQKIKHFEQLIQKAKKELSDEHEKMDDKDRIWHEMHDHKSDRRQLRLAVSDPENPQSERIWEQYGTIDAIMEALVDINAKISHQEALIKMLDAGMSLPNEAQSKDLDSPERLEEYRRALDHMIKEQVKIQQLEEKAKELGIDVKKLKDLM